MPGDNSWVPPAHVLITGGTGFVGTYLIRSLLAQGRQVTAFANDDFSPQSLFVLGDLASRVRVVHGDIRDAGKIAEMVADLRPDAIVHTAARVGLESSLENPALSYDINVNGTIAVLEAARLHGVGKVVYTSSNSVYHLKQYEPIDEQHPFVSTSAGNPAAHYGMSKMAAEQIGLVYATFHGLDFVALRIASVYGFGMRGTIYVRPMVEAAVANRPLAVQGGPMKRDYTSIADTVGGMMLALDRDTRGIEQRVFNMSGGRTTSVRELAEAVKRQIPGAVITVGDTLTEAEQFNIRQRGALSSARAEALLGFRARQDIDAGLSDFIAAQRAFQTAGGTV